MPVYPMPRLHARTKRVWRAAASPTAAKSAWNGASVTRAQLERASNDGCGSVRGPATRRPRAPRA
jgi:hypothetical protein